MTDDVAILFLNVGSSQLMNSAPSQTITSDSSAAPLRVMIADDSYLIRQGLNQLLELAPAIDVVGLYPDAASLMAAIELNVPDVVITDIRMPPTFTDEGMQVAERLRMAYPQVGVLVLSQHGNVQFAAQLLDGSSARRGYLLKDRISDLNHIVSTIEALAFGECRIDASLIDELFSLRRKRATLEILTPRQIDILSDVAVGKSNLAIARARGLTQRAVEKHISETFARLGLANDESVSRRVRATLMYLDQFQA